MFRISGEIIVLFGRPAVLGEPWALKLPDLLFLLAFLLDPPLNDPALLRRVAPPWHVELMDMVVCTAVVLPMECANAWQEANPRNIKCQGPDTSNVIPLDRMRLEI